MIAPYYSSWLALTAVSLALLIALMGWGTVLLRGWPQLRVARTAPARQAESLVYGVIMFSVLGFGGVLMRVPLVLMFASVSAVLLLVALALRRRVEVLDEGERVAGTVSERAVGVWGAPALVLAGSLVWSITNLRGLEPNGAEVMLVPWVDMLIHARQIANFAAFRGDLGTLHWSMVGEQLPLYHYGSYMFAALVRDVGGASAIQVATSVYPVVGMLLTGAAMLVLAQSTAGPGCSLLALALLYGVPDPSSFVPGMTRQNSYFFFQQVGVGGAYAVAVLGLALALALRGRSTGMLAPSACALGLLLVAVLFKVQIVLAYGALFAALVVMSASRLSAVQKAVGVVAIFLIAGAGLWALAAMPGAPTMKFSLTGARQLFAFAGRGQFDNLMTLLLLPAAAVGVWLVTYGALLPLSAVLARRLHADRSVRIALVLMAMALLANAAIRLLVADNRGAGDAAEINRKTFVLPYFVFVYATAVLLWRQVNVARPWFDRQRRPMVVLAGAMAVASVASAWRLQIWPDVGDRYAGVALSAPLLDAATFLRRNTPATDVVQLCENDGYLAFGALAERPTYMALITLHPGGTAKANETERARLDRLQALVQAADLDAARTLARQSGIDWLLLTPGCQPAWESSVSPTLVRGGYRLVSF